MPPPRHHPLARAPLVDRGNRLLARAWPKGWLAVPPLDLPALWAKASKGFSPDDESAGRSAVEVADFRLRLEKLAGSAAAEAQLNPVGLAAAHGQLVRAIRQRLALGRLWRARPELPATTLAPPILVVGQMRAGTTRLHRLLAADPAHVATRFCDSWNPVPQRPDLRPLRGAMALALGRLANPWLDTLHPFGASEPDEELGWLAAALDHATYEAQWRIPSFVAFSEARDPAPVYAEFARILATDAGWHRNSAQPRVMKVPQFAEDLAAVLARFSDARVVVARRDPAAVHASACSLVANQMAMQSDAVDLAWLEQEWHRKAALREARMEAALAKFTGPVAVVEYDVVSDDWQSAMRGIYSALGLAFTPAAAAGMARVMRAGDDAAHRRHADSLRHFAAQRPG